MSTRPQSALRQRLRLPGAVRRGVQQRLRGSRLAPPRQFDSRPIHVQRRRFAIVGDLRPRPPRGLAPVECPCRAPADPPDCRRAPRLSGDCRRPRLVGPPRPPGPHSTSWLSPCGRRVPILPSLATMIMAWRVVRGSLTSLPVSHNWTAPLVLDDLRALGLIFLDSNMRRLPAALGCPSSMVSAGSSRALSACLLSGVCGVAAPPPIRTALVADSRAVQRTFVPPFLQAENPRDGGRTRA